MSKEEIEKSRAVTILVECAEKYRNHLLNKTLLFICVDKHKKVSTVEVSFDASNFLHLTGCKTKHLSANDFFNHCIDHKLSIREFELAGDGTSTMKMKVLPALMSKNLNANSIGEFIGGRPYLKTNKLAGGVRGCMGFVNTKPSGRFVPNTVLAEDIRKITHSQLRIVATYRKTVGEDRYSEIVYSAKKIDWDKIQYPENYAYLPKPKEIHKQ